MESVARGRRAAADQARVAYLRDFNPDVTFAAHVAGYLVRSPFALALLLWLAGPTTQKQVGRILGNLASGAGLEESDGEAAHWRAGGAWRF